jgi:hypothetical protein
MYLVTIQEPPADVVRPVYRPGTIFHSLLSLEPKTHPKTEKGPNAEKITSPDERTKDLIDFVLWKDYITFSSPSHHPRLLGYIKH